MVSAPPTRRTRARDDLSSTPIVATQQTVVQREKLSLDAAQQSISVTLGRRGSRHRIESGEEPPSKKAKIVTEIPLVEVSISTCCRVDTLFLMNVGSRIPSTPYKGCSKTFKTGG